jgi:hypothetical protein
MRSGNRKQHPNSPSGCEPLLLSNNPEERMLVFCATKIAAAAPIRAVSSTAQISSMTSATRSTSAAFTELVRMNAHFPALQ